jgi:hypothetical protein
MTTTFEITDDHVRLLRAVSLRWEDCEFGAPAVDPKRPYGNSSVLTDMARIVNPAFAQMRESEMDAWLDENGDRLESLHRDLLTVLLIGAQTGVMLPGRYVRERVSSWRWGPWRRLEGDPA